MTRRTFYPSVEEALYLHELLMERFGGEGGVRDLGLLDSALVRPRSGYYHSLSEQAAALLQSLALNHAFLDGNIRLAYALMDVFLRTNHVRLVASADDAETFLIERVIKAHAALDEISGWIEEHSEAA